MQRNGNAMTLGNHVVIIGGGSAVAEVEKFRFSVFLPAWFGCLFTV